MTAQLLQAKLKNHWTVKLKLTTQQSGRTAHKIERERKKRKRDQSMKKRKARDGKRDIKGEMVVKLSPKQSKLDF